MALPGRGIEPDRRAVGFAIAAQVGVAAVIALTNLPTLTALVIPVVGGVVAGSYSRNFETEYLDGALACAAAPIIAPVMGLLGSWLYDPAVTSDVIAHIASIIFSIALPVIFIGITMSAVLGAFLSYQTATLRRQAAGGIEIK